MFSLSMVSFPCFCSMFFFQLELFLPFSHSFIFFSSCVCSYVQLGSTAIGIRTSEGVVLAVEKRVTSPLMESKSVEKIVEIDCHLGCAMSGLIADSRTLVDKARVEAQVSYELEK